MKEARSDKQYFFVDESGDPTFYDKNGNLIVGNEGCSKILLLGFITTDDPGNIRQALLNLKDKIARDKYLEEIPSIKKTLRAFHAKDDCAEVRQAVFKITVDLEFKAQFVVARKIERIFRNRFQHDENRFYDYLATRLFQNVLHKNQVNVIYFAKRGSRKRQTPLQQALQAGIKTFEEKWQVKVESRFDVQSQSLVGEPGYPGNYYSKRNPLKVEKISPL